jgi:hypothetical protein
MAGYDACHRTMRKADSLWCALIIDNIVRSSYFYICMQDAVGIWGGSEGNFGLKKNRTVFGAHPCPKISPKSQEIAYHVRSSEIMKQPLPKMEKIRE